MPRDRARARRLFVEMELSRIASVATRRFDRLGLPADDEFGEGFDVRLWTRSQSWVTATRRTIDSPVPAPGRRYGRQRFVVSRPGDAPLPPSRRPNQVGNLRHALSFAEREQVVGEVFAASRPRRWGCAPYPVALPFRGQRPRASQLSEYRRSSHRSARSRSRRLTSPSATGRDVKR